MEVKEVNVGDKVELRTSEKTWEGTILQSYDAETILLKLDSGYNIGIKDCTSFHEVDMLKMTKPFGINITLHLKNVDTHEQGIAFLHSLLLPLK